MKVLIVGYGRMGREIEKILLDKGHSISARVDLSPGVGDFTALTDEIIRGSDAVIEFSLPEGLKENIHRYARSGLPAVIGTTGWDSQFSEIKAIVEKCNSSLVYGSNFSLGANIFFALTEKAASMIADITDYDIFVTEYHHKLKKDSPSGTALTTAQRILKACPRKKMIQPEKLDRAIRDEELHVASVRGGSIPGIHTVTLDSMADTIEVTHSARSRQGFALGAVLAAEWLCKTGKPGFYHVDDFMKDFLNI